MQLLSFLKRTALPLAVTGLLLTSCEIDEQFDPNNPSIDSVLTDASLAELNLLANGVEGGIRNGFGTYVTATGSIARELYIFDADPRNTEDLLGKEDATLDANTFYLTAPFFSSYNVIKTGNILLEALDGTDAESAAENAGYSGFTRTMQALMYSRVLDMLGTNGIRFDVSDPNNLGPFLSQMESEDRILELYDRAFGELTGGAEFAFNLSSGYAGFTTPATFAQVNRALAARTAIRANRFQEALDYVNASFLDLDGDLATGPKMLFSTAPGDQLNPLFKPRGQSGDQIIVHPRIIDGIEEGDERFSKFGLRVNATSQDGLNSDYETALYATATTPIDVIRNEELVLIYAEANIQLGNLEEGVRGLNIVRNAAGLGDYDGEVSQDALIDELLYNRCYSLWGEGHKMFDLRRYNRLNANFLPLDREGDDIFTQFPIPLAEGV